MSIEDQIPSNGFKHNYLRLICLVGTLVLFIGYAAIDKLYELGNNAVFSNESYRVEELYDNDITPSEWVYRCLNIMNYFWQLAWLLYSLSFIFRRSTTGYLYLSPKTLTLTFFTIYIIGFAIQTVWLLAFYKKYMLWTWIVYLASFLLLSIALFIINNNLAVNKQIYETQGFNSDVWCLRFLTQNGVAFFACWTAIHFILTLDIFLQLQCNISLNNADTISLIIVAIIASGFFFGSNLSAMLNDRSAYQFSPWLVFIIYFWGVIENNWDSNNLTRNNIIALVEFIASILSALIALILFTIRFRSSKQDLNA